LDLSQSSHNGSLTPCTNVAIATFALVFFGGDKKQAKTLVSTSFQPISVWLGGD